jgi:hypothetical protein
MTMDVTAEAQRRWERTPRGKVICPECGLTGYPGGKWAVKHALHVTCTCGRRVSSQGLPAHRGSMARHGNPCPEGVTP